MKQNEPAHSLNSARLLPGGVPSVLSLRDERDERYITRGKGGHCWDQFDTMYIDFICGYGPVILGHSHAEVNAAVIEQLAKGMLFPSNSPLHDELNAKLKQLFPYSHGTLF